MKLCNITFDYSAIATAINEITTATLDIEAMLAPLTPGSSIFSSAVDDDESIGNNGPLDDESTGNNEPVDDEPKTGDIDDDEPKTGAIDEDDENRDKPLDEEPTCGKPDDDETGRIWNGAPQTADVRMLK